jgi:hypothetical protein
LIIPASGNVACGFDGAPRPDAVNCAPTLAGVTALTVAVNVTACPAVEGLGELVSVMLLVIVLTLNVTVPVLVTKSLLPEYVAVKVAVPALDGANEQLVAGNVIVHVSPDSVPPSRIAIVPLGVPAPGDVTATLALTVTDWPRLIEAGGVIVVVVAAAFTV